MRTGWEMLVWGGSAVVNALSEYLAARHLPFAVWRSRDLLVSSWIWGEYCDLPIRLVWQTTLSMLFFLKQQSLQY